MIYAVVTFDADSFSICCTFTKREAKKIVKHSKKLIKDYNKITDSKIKKDFGIHHFESFEDVRKFEKDFEIYHFESFEDVRKFEKDLKATLFAPIEQYKEWCNATLF